VSIGIYKTEPPILYARMHRAGKFLAPGTFKAYPPATHSQQ